MYRRSRQTAWRTIADETVLLDLEKKQMYGLNPTGAFVWLTLEAVRDFDELLDAIRAAGESTACGREDLRTFLDQLLELGLAEEARPDERQQTPAEPPETLEPPCILWHEEVEQIAGTCAFLPAMNPLCTQAPFA